MKVQHASGSTDHLCYCSNIHAGESWQEVRENLGRFIPDIRNAMAPAGEFGIGLRLSAVAVEELSEPAALTEFQQFLSKNQLYVFTINGFPYGPFHGTRVKEEVYLPDWLDPERLRYTNQLADVFSAFLPAGQTGSISTVPGAFKSCVTAAQDVVTMASNMVAHAAHLVELERKTGKSITLALEPEPCCFLETIDESVAFFTDYLFSDRAITQLSALCDVDHDRAATLLRKHLTLCLDLCHAAVEFEDPDECLDKLSAAHVSVGKVQISSGLRLQNVTPASVSALKPFDDNVYLHQVVEKYDGRIKRYTDLSDAFASLNSHTQSLSSHQREWRVHFHVPIFLDKLNEFSSTQCFIADMLARHRKKQISTHLEVETYTWNVLPESLRTQSIDKAIVRELRWVVDSLT